MITTDWMPVLHVRHRIMNKTTISAIICLLPILFTLSACDIQRADDQHSAEDYADYQRQVEIYWEQTREAERQLEESRRQLEETRIQGERFEKLLDRWEVQADRKDALLKKQEELLELQQSSVESD